MTFCEQLNEYISKIDCSSKELADTSNLSPTVISRYRNGERTPNIRSKQLESLVDGLYQLASERNVDLKKEDIYKTLSITLNDVHIDLEQLVKNFNDLTSALNISMADLSF